MKKIKTAKKKCRVNFVTNFTNLTKRILPKPSARRGGVKIIIFARNF
jgi:hypothetical protein